jgi:uncharacterized membrane protein YvbJ
MPMTWLKLPLQNDGTPLTESDLKPLARLTKNRLYRSTLRTMIMDKQTNGMVQVVKQGSYLLLFPKYKVKLGTANVTVKTNLDAAAFTMDGNQIQPENRSGSYTIASQLPGLYALKAERYARRKYEKTSIVKSSSRLKGNRKH